MLDLERRFNNVFSTAPLAFAAATALNLSTDSRGVDPILALTHGAVVTGAGMALTMAVWELTVNYNKNLGRKTEIMMDTFVMGSVIGGVSTLLLMPLR